MNRLPAKRVLIWRFVTGAHLDGRPRTNATWFKEGRTPKHYCNWWNRKPRFYRAMWRDIPTLVLFLEFDSYGTSPQLFAALNGCVFIALGYLILSKKDKMPVTRKVKVDTRATYTPLDEEDRAELDAIGVDLEEDKKANARIVQMSRKRKAQ